MRLKNVLAAALLLASAAEANAQGLGLPRPHADWRTIETRHFVVHYPREYTEWTLPMVEQLESVHAAVSAMIGSQPAERVTVIVEDPFNVSNGSANPGPLIYLWPTPPDPRSIIGENRSWSELLAVHEYAHVAHLARPSRNPRTRALFRLFPVPVDPIAVRMPRWAIEGYATYIEGQLTGSGRPYGVWRPTLLRQWALEGRLPTYGQLNGADGFYGGAMAYLAGSAFFEWLIAREGGEDKLPDVWRRMTAYTDRGFAPAFAGVFGSPPDELYGRFVAELTGRALAVEDTLKASGIVTGEQVQRLEWNTGDPAVSRDGEHIAIVLRSQDDPSRVVIWKTEPDTLTDEERKERERAFERDSVDVRGVEWRPRPRKAVATLHPVGGRPHDSPRFLPDGERLLVTRPEPLGDGRFRPDLFIWNFESGGLRRVTRGAGIRHPDPAPDGRSAAAVQCLGGVCDLVRVDLASGRIDIIAEGGPDRSYYRPRHSPEGSRLAVSLQSGNGWRTVLVDPSSGTVTDTIGPDDGANRFDAAWMPDGRSIVLTSSAGGLLHLERVTVASGETVAITRGTGAAVAPEPDPADGSVYYLSLRSRGLDLNRVFPDSVRVAGAVAIDPALTPAAPRAPLDAEGFERATLPPSRPYGMGQRNYFYFPTAVLAAEGLGGGLMLASSDPVGRLGWVAQGLYGEKSTWRGGSLAAAYRRYRPSINGELFFAAQRPSEQNVGDFVLGTRVLDVEYTGATAFAELLRDFHSRGHRYRLGASTGRLQGFAFDADTRHLAFADYRGLYAQSVGTVTFSQSIDLTGSAGSTAGEQWTRVLATAGVGYISDGSGLRAEVMYGRTDDDAPLYERFVLGGARPPLVDRSVMSQRLAFTGLPVGVLGGTEIAGYRATLTSADVLSPYYAAMSSDDGFDDWYRVVGSEVVLDGSAVPYIAVPGVRMTAGFAYPLDEPLKKRTQYYLTLSFVP